MPSGPVCCWPRKASAPSSAGRSPGNITDSLGAIALVGFVIVAAATIPFAVAGPHTSEWLLALWMTVGSGSAP